MQRVKIDIFLNTQKAREFPLALMSMVDFVFGYLL